MTHLKILFAIILALLLPQVLCSQIKLLDDNSGQPVPYAHVFLDNVYYTYSDENGQFTIAPGKEFDTLKIAHLTYETKYVGSGVLKDIIALKEKATTLNEVSIIGKRRTLKTKTLLPEKAYTELLGKGRDMQLTYATGRVYGEDPDGIKISVAVYVPNEKPLENAFVKKIILKSVDSQVDGYKAYIPLLVNLMTYDTVTHLPKTGFSPKTWHWANETAKM